MSMKRVLMIVCNEIAHLPLARVRNLLILTYATGSALLAYPVDANAQIQTLGYVDDVSINYDDLGGGIYSLYAAADFVAEVATDAGGDWEFKSELRILGGVATVGPGYTTLSPGQTATWTYDTAPNPTVSTAGLYTALASVHIRIPGLNLPWSLEDLAEDEVTIPDEEM